MFYVDKFGQLVEKPKVQLEKQKKKDKDMPDWTKIKENIEEEIYEKRKNKEWDKEKALPIGKNL